jgi:hypothetical protein
MLPRVNPNRPKEGHMTNINPKLVALITTIAMFALPVADAFASRSI